MDYLMKILVLSLVCSGFVNSKPLEMTEAIEDYMEPLIGQKLEEPVGLVPDITVDVHDVIHVHDDDDGETAPELFIEPETVDDPELNVRFSNVWNEDNVVVNNIKPKPLTINDQVNDDKNEFRLEEIDTIKNEEPIPIIKEWNSNKVVDNKELFSDATDDEAELVKSLTNNKEQLKDPKPESETVLEIMNDETEKVKNELENEFITKQEAKGPANPGSIWYFGPVVDRNIPSSRFMLPPVLQFPAPDLPNIFTNNPVNTFFVDKLKSLQDSLAVLITTLEGRDKTTSKPEPEPATAMYL